MMGHPYMICKIFSLNKKQSVMQENEIIDYNILNFLKLLAKECIL
jgi:hypothetical protein